MTTTGFITELFCPIDDRMKLVPKHPQASLWPSEVVALGVLSALQSVGSRAFYRWLLRDCRTLFPPLPSRTWLLRVLKTYDPVNFSVMEGLVKLHMVFIHIYEH